MLMRINNTIIFASIMAHNQTNTYQVAKTIFQTLALKEDTYIDIPKEDIKLFRKHLSEMIKRQQSTNKYATRDAGLSGVKVIRIE
jgi:pyrimidine operon attenuation protein/uracil phosphoribosyltransferase